MSLWGSWAFRFRRTSALTKTLFISLWGFYTDGSVVSKWHTLDWGTLQPFPKKWIITSPGHIWQVLFSGKGKEWKMDKWEEALKTGEVDSCKYRYVLCVFQFVSKLIILCVQCTGFLHSSQSPIYWEFNRFFMVKPVKLWEISTKTRRLKMALSHLTSAIIYWHAYHNFVITLPNY